MRILVLCTDQGVRVPGDKGASLHLRAVADGYHRLGHDVLLMAVAGHGDPGLPCRTWLLPHPGRATGLERERRKLGVVERFAAEGAAVAEEFAPDLVHERLALFGTAGLRIAERTGARHVLEVNALLAQEEAQWRGLEQVDLAREREREVLLGADHVVTVSREWEEAVRAVRGDGVTTVPNGVDADAFTAPLDRDRVRSRLGADRHARLVAFVGTLRPWHGVEDAVRALLWLPPEVRLVVVGDGPVDLHGLARQIGVADRLVLTGRLDHRDAAAVLRAADVGVAPYPPLADFAFSPLKVLDYLAAGLPFVASRQGQVAELVAEHGSGRLVTPGDPEDLARGILRTLRDPAAVERAASAREQVLVGASWPARLQQVLVDSGCAARQGTAS